MFKSTIRIASLVRDDAQAFGFYDAAIIAKKKRKLTFQQAYWMLFGRYPTK